MRKITATCQASYWAGYELLWAELCLHQIHMSNFKPLMLHNVTLFGDRAFQEVIKVK